MISAVLAVAGRRVLAVVLVLAAALLVKGYTAAGDGFGAGAVVAVGLGVQILSGGREQAERQPLLRHAGLIALAGLVVALTVTFAPLVFGDPPMTHWPPPGAHVTKLGSVELISAVLFDVGVFGLVVGAVGGILALLSDPQLDVAAEEADA